MAEAGSEPPLGTLVDSILQAAPPHAGRNIKAPEAVANKTIKAAAAKLEREEMAASPTHTMRRRDEGGLASAVQGAAQHTARPDLHPVVAAVQERVRAMQQQGEEGAAATEDQA